jgi:hypothetical protein
MADLGFDGMIWVAWVPTIADISAPKAATELNAAGAVVLHTRLTPDGLATGAGSDTIDTSKMSSTFNTKIVGRRNFDGLQLTYVRGDATNEKLLDTTLIYRASGYLVVRRDKLATVAVPPPRTRSRCTRCSAGSRSTPPRRRTRCRRSWCR